MSMQSELNQENCIIADIKESAKGFNPFADFSYCALKKCCKKYKRGKRCKKCPDR
jgi:hypothetical protein